MDNLLNECEMCHKQFSADSILLAKNNQRDYIFCHKCIDILTEGRNQLHIKSDTADIKLMPLRELINTLKSVVVGQDVAIEQLAATYYTHFSYIKRQSDKHDFKTNVLLIGPTGCGKTMIAKKLASMMDVPFVHLDATTLTEAGFVGHDADLCVEQLLKKTNYDISRAEIGVVFIDEIDKLHRKESSNRSNATNGPGVQQALLKLVEGTDVYVTDPKNHNSHIVVNTKNILFIFAGAFEGIFDIVDERVGGSQFAYSSKVTNRYDTKYNDVMKQLTAADLEKFGMIVEFIGRVQNIIQFQSLSDEAIRSIIKQAFTNYEYRLGTSVKFVVSDDAMDNILKSTKEQKTGGRAVLSVIWNILKTKMAHIVENNDKHVNIHIEQKDGQTVITDILLNDIETVFVNNVNTNVVIDLNNTSNPVA